MRRLLLTAFAVLVVPAAPSDAAPSTAFTYQGRLIDGGGPANGTYDLEFRLFDVDSGGSQLATDLAKGVLITGGLFTVEVDFRLSPFNGDERWLEVAVRP